MGFCKGLTCFVWTGAIATLIITMLMVFNPTMFISVDDVANPETLQSALADVTNTATTLGWISSGLSGLGTVLSIRNARADRNTINEAGYYGEHKVNWQYTCAIIMAGLLLMAAPLLLHMDFGHTIGTSVNSMYFASVACGLVGSFLLIGSRSISTTTPIGDAAQASQSISGFPYVEHNGEFGETTVIDGLSFGPQVGGGNRYGGRDLRKGTMALEANTGDFMASRMYGTAEQTTSFANQTINGDELADARDLRNGTIAGDRLGANRGHFMASNMHGTVGQPTSFANQTINDDELAGASDISSQATNDLIASPAGGLLLSEQQNLVGGSSKNGNDGRTIPAVNRRRRLAERLNKVIAL